MTQQHRPLATRESSRTSEMKNNYVIDIQGFRDEKGGFLPKEVAVLSLNARILGHWVVQAPHDFNSLPSDIKTSNNYCTLNLHGIEWYDGNVALDDVRVQLRKICRQARTIFVRGYDKVKWLESLLGRRIVNLEDYEHSVKYAAMEREFGGGLYCWIHGLEELSEKRFYCALNRAHLLKHWLGAILHAYHKEHPECARYGNEDFYSALWHMEAKKTMGDQYVAMNELLDVIESEYAELENVDSVDNYDDNDDDDDDDGENPYEIPGIPVVETVATRMTNSVDMAKKNNESTNNCSNEEEEAKEENNDVVDDNDDDGNNESENSKISNNNNKGKNERSTLKQQQQQQQQQQLKQQHERTVGKQQPSQPRKENKNQEKIAADSRAKVKRRLDFCCIIHKPSYRNSDNDGCTLNNDDDDDDDNVKSTGTPSNLQSAIDASSLSTAATAATAAAAAAAAAVATSAAASTTDSTTTATYVNVRMK